MFHNWPVGESSEPSGDCTDHGNMKTQDYGERLDCNYDWTGEMLKHMYFNIKDSPINAFTWKPKKGKVEDGLLMRFD